MYSDICSCSFYDIRSSLVPLAGKGMWGVPKTADVQTQTLIHCIVAPSPSQGSDTPWVAPGWWDINTHWLLSCPMGQPGPLLPEKVCHLLGGLWVVGHYDTKTPLLSQVVTQHVPLSQSWRQLKFPVSGGWLVASISSGEVTLTVTVYDGDF